MTINPSDDTGKHLLIPRSTRQKQTKRVERRREDTADELDLNTHAASEVVRPGQIIVPSRMCF